MTSTTEPEGGASHDAPKRYYVANSAEVSFRLVSRDELSSLNEEAIRSRWGARWSSADALRGQVRENAAAILSPALQNGADQNGRETYRCFVWFYTSSGGCAVSLMDVAVDKFAELRELASVEQLKKAARAFLDGYVLTPLE